jgi:hypothetical protein
VLLTNSDQTQEVAVWLCAFEVPSSYTSELMLGLSSREVFANYMVNLEELEYWKNQTKSHLISMYTLSKTAASFRRELQAAEEELANRSSFVEAASSALRSSMVVHELERARMRYEDLRSNISRHEESINKDTSV